ncbi:centromere protein U [Orycteropus afer afer]|uniref:Centromere protein U n=1 Tax=Orycteropus afer afer TaxID=1230840 RepID=A0A8B6ZVB9_ORYAF|nr:centromere protein U [Orycteropus afer afer]
MPGFPLTPTPGRDRALVQHKNRAHGSRPGLVALRGAGVGRRCAGFATSVGFETGSKVARLQVGTAGSMGTKYLKNTLGRTHPMKDKADQKHKPLDVFDFPENSDISSIGRLGESEQDEEPYETFAPPLHSTAIYADEEEFSKQCGSSIPSTPQGKEEGRSLNTSEYEASKSNSVKNHAQELRGTLTPIIDESENTEKSDVTRKDKPAEKISTQQCEFMEAVNIPVMASLERSEKPAKSVTPKKKGPLNALKKSSEKEIHVTESQQKAQKKGTKSRGKGKKSRSKDVDSDSDISNSTFLWCVEGRKTSEIMELDIVLSAFEKTFLEYKQRIESRVCKEAINKFYVILKEELINMIKEVQMLKNLKRKNAQVISGIKKKRQRLIEVQDELLRLEPQLKQLQTKYDELKERKSSLKNAAYFVSNLKQLHQDYSDVREKEPEAKEMYDSSSLPALLLKARGLLGAENHLRNINHQLEKLLGQE